jgi:hypothetical protein
MPTTDLFPVENLKLDLGNFRTVKQANEVTAFQTMVSISPERFWALTQSLLEDGYHPTENIIVLKQGKDSIVKEGNRRIAALKLIHGILGKITIELPSDIKKGIASVSKEWKAENAKVPCAIYGESEAKTVARIVRLAHGKGEKAGRDFWNAVASARHNRDENGESEPALDILEKYIASGKNISDQQRERWSGVYPLSVLDEATKKIAPRLGFASARDMAENYPNKISHRSSLENIIFDIGLLTLTFPAIRNSVQDFASNYGIPEPKQKDGGGTAGGAKDGGDKGGSASEGKGGKDDKDKESGNGKGGGKRPTKAAAIPAGDPRAVTLKLRAFVPRGTNREKVATLLIEARKLKIVDCPNAFCFVLRSMFEISAKAYCNDHKATGGPKAAKDGREKPLADLLKEIYAHLTNGGKDKELAKELYGATTELSGKTGLFSVTSMNQLVHNPSFHVDTKSICLLFANVFPLLEAMNR